MMKKEYSDAAYDAFIGSLFVRFPAFQKCGDLAYKPGLERSEEICRIMGNPQDAYRCIHVAGTNGKGSTCNMLAAQLAARGLKVGLYTSPHISDFRERMRIVTSSGTSMVPRTRMWDYLCEYEEEFDRLQLSFFEITTAVAFRFFADSRVDAAVIETGLGGRLDATNVITPVLSVITNIGFDHMKQLGYTLGEIAAEKAGIIKPGVPVVIGEAVPETEAVFRRVAAGAGSRIFFAEEMPLPWPDAEDVMAGLLKDMDLKGSYQAKNVKTVLAAMDVLGLDADLVALKDTAKICDFHARWEQVCENPHTICDIGHNAHGLKYNFAMLDALLDSGEYSDIVMVYGSVADKDVGAVLRMLPSRAYVFFTAADSPRSMPAAELYARSGHEYGQVCGSVADAVRAAAGRCRSLEKPLLYIGGSTYVVAEALDEIKEYKYR